jgi:hypothetical protein
MKFKKIKKWKTSAWSHDMICDVVPRKNAKHGIPRFHRKTLHKKMPPRRTSLGFLPN